MQLRAIKDFCEKHTDGLQSLPKGTHDAKSDSIGHKPSESNKSKILLHNEGVSHERISYPILNPLDLESGARNS